MPGLYFHIPFCQKACHYCNFYFVLSKNKEIDFVNAIVGELQWKQNWLSSSKINSIYFGGGTPSLMNSTSLIQIIKAVQRFYDTSNVLETTLEANPEDITIDKLLFWKSIGINRLSIGIQSFFEEDLTSMNRSHNALQAHQAIELAKQYFDNISIDLMFGLPFLTSERWKANLSTVVQYNIPHVSCYNLTIEEKTALERKIKQKQIQVTSEDIHIEQFFEADQFLESKGFHHYEISNYCKPGFESKHNQSYWNQEEYLGFGPSAHSLIRNKRSWNINNLNQYIEKINSEKVFYEFEVLTLENLYNEYILTHLRTKKGIQILYIKENFGEGFLQYFMTESQKLVEEGLLFQEFDSIKLTSKGIVIADRVSSELMYVN